MTYDPTADKIAQHEAAAHEVRRWVRLTSLCNNRCLFCLDSAMHDGTYGVRSDIEREIRAGRDEGATRLILSGGEPTIHPDFVAFVALGREVGYRKIQTVTNGRMFVYPGFLERCVDAGLSEITFSIHGHEARVHDALVGVKGAFREEVSALRMALAEPRLVVNVDVCLNRGNVRRLPELLDRLIALGVRELDLLHIVPFGRAWDEGSRALFYDIDEALAALRHALELSDREDLHIWFNRFPPPYLEGYEHLIQDPHKLLDEVRGREAELEGWQRDGVPLRCREPDRCSRCYLRSLCDRFEEAMVGVREGRFDVLRIDARAGRVPERLPGGLRAAWLRAATVDQALALAERLPGEDLWLELDSYDGLADALSAGRFGGKRLRRAYADTASALRLLLGIDGDFEVTAWLVADVAEALVALGEAPARLTVAQRRYERVTEARERDVDLRAFFARFRTSSVRGVPQCISGRAPLPPERVLDAGMLAPEGGLDLVGFTHDFIVEQFTTKSRRCRGCAVDAVCEGAHINTIRAHGYRILEPID